jgi:hypothetical protein
MYLLLLLLFCASCRHDDVPPIYATVEIPGRLSDQPLYRAKMPPGWRYQRPEAVTDTTQAIAEFYDPSGSIRFTFHNFPTDKQVPPMAQIQRWKQQFDQLPSSVVKPQSFAGFVGYLFEATGTFDGEAKTVLGWAMQLAPEHAQHLQAPTSHEEALRFKEMGASFTLKAVAPPALMESHKRSLLAFARSFELVSELPSEL